MTHDHGKTPIDNDDADADQAGDPPLQDSLAEIGNGARSADTPLLSAALALAAEGFPVLPVRACTKRPHIKGWPKRASTNTEDVNAWWNKWSDANPGYVTGEKSGVLVVEIDPRNGGEESLETLEAERGKLPDTETVYSGRGDGGRHLLFRHPEFRVYNNAGTLLGPGIDVKGDGGFVMGPGALHPKTGRPYWVDRGDLDDDGDQIERARIAEAPEWLVSLLRKRSENRPELGDLPPVEDRWEVPMEERAARCRRYLQACPDAISGAGGHDKTFRAACECYRFALDHEAALDVMSWWSEHKSGSELWTPKELHHKLEDALQRVVADDEFGAQLSTPPQSHEEPAEAPVEEGPAGVSLAVAHTRKAVKGERITIDFALHLHGEDTGLCITVTNSATGQDRAVKALITRLADEGHAASDLASLRAWAYRLFAGPKLAELHRDHQERIARARQGAEEGPIMRRIATEYAEEAFDLRFAYASGRAWSETLGRSVKREEFIRKTPSRLLDRLRDALDGRANEDDAQAVVTAERVLRVAWADVCTRLLHETGDTGLGPGSKAARHFEQIILDLFHAPEVWISVGTDRALQKVKTTLARQAREMVTAASSAGIDWTRVVPGLDAFLRVTDGSGAFLAVREGLFRGQVKTATIDSVRSLSDLKTLLDRYGLARPELVAGIHDNEIGGRLDVVLLSDTVTRKVLRGNDGPGERE